MGIKPRHALNLQKPPTTPIPLSEGKKKVDNSSVIYNNMTYLPILSCHCTQRKLKTSHTVGRGATSEVAQLEIRKIRRQEFRIEKISLSLWRGVGV